MAHPGNYHTGHDVHPIPRRPRERLAGGAFEAVTRVAGLRAGMLPDHLRRQLSVIGVRDDQLARVLPSLTSLAGWPEAWEAEGEAQLERGDMFAAWSAFYVAQRILIAQSPRKAELYARARHAYGRVAQPAIEHLRIPTPSGETVAVMLQLPRRRRPGAEGPVPCVLAVPGVTGTKEELHAWVMPLLDRGWAVARLDHPGYGETTGRLDDVSIRNPRFVLEHLATDARLDPDGLHLYGMSLGSFIALHAAIDSRVASITAICPPFRPGRYFRQLPTLNLLALQEMTGLRDVNELVRFAERYTLEPIAPRLDVPVRIFHGGRDRTVPVGDGVALAHALGGPAALTVYDRDHHSCLEHLEEITVGLLEFIADPWTVARTHALAHHVDEPAPDVATEGVAPGSGMRRGIAARLPFLLPWARPTSVAHARGGRGR